METYRRITIVLMALSALIVTASAMADELPDVYGGNGEKVMVTLSKVRYEAHFSPGDMSTDGGRVKVSIPYNGSPKDDGFWLCKGGEVFIGKLGYSNKEFSGSVYSQPFTVPAGGKGPVILEFENPSKPGDPMEMVISVSKDGNEKEWLCIPWEGKKLRFAIPNPAHPKGAQHTTAFKVDGDKVTDMVDAMVRDGWKPVAEYWKNKGRRLTLKELTTGKLSETK